ncbi:hypothetical protein C5167_034769 [Papaver somniferum]|uniref:F-box domain-containing protein n=1 Tax=Papaver somniferum TaxID=3469 RepID=A0A4Y7KI40_PAPSO|nr:F-box/kelch-repeat protein At1g15670-like [Papaver somniferum]RZC71629.1 hypothetical protein C5167_034769 [Papaver somniferum]
MEIIPGLPDEIGRECLIRTSYDQFSTVSSISRKWKQEIQSKEFHHQRKTQGFNQSLIVLIQSDPISTSTTKPPKTHTTPAHRLSLYEPGKNEWHKLPPIPGYEDGLPLFCKCTGVGRNLVVIGGLDTKTYQVLNSVFIYDLVTCTWRRGADFPGGERSFFACASDQNRMVFIAGGHDDGKNALRSALAYDVLDDMWIPLPDMAKQRDECKGLFHGGKFHVISGYQTDMQGKFDKSTETFDADTWKWDPVEEQKLETEMCPRTYAFDHQGKLYKCVSSHLERLDGSAWRRLTELPNDVCNGTFVAMRREKMLVIGSGVQNGPQSCYALEFGRSKNQDVWTKLEIPEECTGFVHYGCNLDI